MERYPAHLGSLKSLAWMSGSTLCVVVSQIRNSHLSLRSLCMMGTLQFNGSPGAIWRIPNLRISLRVIWPSETKRVRTGWSISCWRCSSLGSVLPVWSGWCGVDDGETNKVTCLVLVYPRSLLSLCIVRILAVCNCYPTYMLSKLISVMRDTWYIRSSHLYSAPNTRP